MTSSVHWLGYRPRRRQRWWWRKSDPRAYDQYGQRRY